MRLYRQPLRDLAAPDVSPFCVSNRFGRGDVPSIAKEQWIQRIPCVMELLSVDRC